MPLKTKCPRCGQGFSIPWKQAVGPQCLVVAAATGILAICGVVLVVGGRSDEAGLPDLPEPQGRVAALVETMEGKKGPATRAAARELGEMGSAARPAIPALVVVATASRPGNDEADPRWAAWEAVKKIDPALAVQFMVHTMQEPERRYWTAFFLSEIPEHAAPAVPALRAVLRSIPSAQTRGEEDAAYQAAKTLASICPEGFAVLLDELTHSNPVVRRAAIIGIPYGESALPAVDGLCDAIWDDSERVRSRAALLLGSIGPHPYAAMAVRARLDMEGEYHIRAKLEKALKTLSAEAQHTEEAPPSL